MELTLSTHILVHHPLDQEAITALAGTGLRSLELWLAEPHLPWRDEHALARLRVRLEAAGLQTSSVHLPFYTSVPELLQGRGRWSVIAGEPGERAQAVGAAADGLRAAVVLGASQAVLHLGWSGDDWGPASSAAARAALLELLEAAHRCQVRLLLENIVSAGTRAAALVRLLDELDPGGDSGVCLDLGHAHVEGGILGQIQDALPRLRHLHVHDNDGSSDQHLAPGNGAIPWGAVLSMLGQAGFRGQGALEIRDPSRGAETAARCLAREMASVRGFQAQWAPHGFLAAPQITPS